jgi:ERCC4-type nuclease
MAGTAAATIYVDHRENAKERFSNKRSPVSYFDKVLDANNRKHSAKFAGAGGGIINYVVKEIPVGDYCIVLHGGILAAAIERKEWKDLSASIVDKRIDRQAKELRAAEQKYECKIFILAEGDFTRSDDAARKRKHEMKFSVLHTKLRHELIRGIPFVQSKDCEHSVKIIVNLARDFIQLHARGEIAFPLQKHAGNDDFLLLSAYARKIHELNDKFRGLAAIAGNNEGISTLLSTIDGISDDIDFASSEIPKPETNDTIGSLINDLPEEFAKRRVAGDSDIRLEMWMAIPGVTANSAPAISEMYHISDLFMKTGEKEELSGISKKLYNIRYPSGARVGERADKIIKNFLTKASSRAAGVKVMSAIPQVTEKAASNILNIYSMSELCDKTRVDVNNLESISRSEKTTIGKALAKKILSFIQKDTAVL